MIKSRLKNIDMFSFLSDEEFDQLANITLLETFKKDNVLFYEGDEPLYFYFLLEGELKLYKTGLKSQEIVLHYFNKPSLIAEMATLENLKFPATCVVMKDQTTVGKIEKKSFFQMLENNSALSLHIIKSLTKKIKNLELSISRNLVFDATAKVCSILKENPSIFQNKKNIQIANLLNMAPETLSRTLSKLKKLEILDEKNELVDVQKLDMFLDF